MNKKKHKGLAGLTSPHRHASSSEIKLKRYRGRILTDEGLLVFTADSTSISVGYAKATFQAWGGAPERSFIEAIKVIALNVALTPIKFSPTFLLDFFMGIREIVVNTLCPANAMKEIFFQAQCISLSRRYPQEGRWRRHPLVRKGIWGHRILQKKYNIPPSHLQHHLLQLARLCPEHILSLCRPLELVSNPSLDYGVDSIVSGPSYNHHVIADIADKLPGIISKMTIGMDLNPSVGTHIYGSYQRGPNGPAIETWERDLKALTLDKKLCSANYKLLDLLSPETRCVLFPEGMKAVTKNEGSKTLRSRSRRKPIHSKLSFIPDGKFGKTRVIAVCDMISQSALTGLNEVLMSILKSLKFNDLTLVQSNLPNHLAFFNNRHNGSLPCTSDCTAWTDRLPRVLNHLIMEELFGRPISDLWMQIVCERTFSPSKVAVQNGVPSELVYGTGTPMGLLTSWSSSAICHHLLVRYCCEKHNKPYDYLILGDDVAIWDRLVYAEYISIMALLGMKLNANKSTTSPIYCEFAKRLFRRDPEYGVIIEVTGLPGTAGQEFLDGNPSGIAGYTDSLIFRSQIVYPQKWLRFVPLMGITSAPVEQIIKLLLFIDQLGLKKASICLRYLLHTWTFTQRNHLLNVCVMLDKAWATSGAAALSKVHNIRATTLNSTSLSELLNLEVSWASYQDRMSVYRYLVASDIREKISASTEKLCNVYFDEDQSENNNPKYLFQLELCLVLAKKLVKKVLNYLISTSKFGGWKVATSELLDPNTSDILVRLDQILSQKTIRRRDINLIRENELGKALYTALQDGSFESIVDTYRHVDYVGLYTTQLKSVTNVKARLNLPISFSDYLSAVVYTTTK